VRTDLASLAFALCLIPACEYAGPSTFPRDAARAPAIQEQALLGLSAEGDAAAVQLIDLEGTPPQLTLFVLDRAGGPTRPIKNAAQEIAQLVGKRLRAEGREGRPLLARLVAEEWPQALALSADYGYRPAAPALPEPGRRRWHFSGAPGAGALPLLLRTAEVAETPRAEVLFLGESPGGIAGGDELELARMPLVGRAVSSELWLGAQTAWLLAGSVQEGEPLQRTVGLRRASLRRGESELHNSHGLADYAQGDLDAARREFGRAIAADPSFVDSLYNAASVAALEDRIQDAVAWLTRAAQADPRRVQVLGRDDDDLKAIRRRPDVRALLGLRRLPPADEEAAAPRPAPR